MSAVGDRALLLSNGHGEDELGALLARRLLDAEPRLTIAAFPLVGTGGAYERADIPVVGVQRVMPSGGFILKGATNLVKDLRAGLFGLAVRQWRHLRRTRGDYDWVIALGDIYCLLLGAYAVRRPLVFVPTAKSEYIASHYGFENRLMCRAADAVFPRDQETANALVQAGVNAHFVGNLMMDALPQKGLRFGLPGDVQTVAFLPGSRTDAYVNLVDILKIAALLPERTAMLLSVAPSLDVAEVGRVAAENGWQAVAAVADETADAPEGVALGLVRDGRVMRVVQGHFGDVLARADIVVGLAGTGNEQAAGLGKPVVTFPGRGMQFTRRFAETQKRLLGDAVSLLERDHQRVADEVVRILGDETTYGEMARVGKERLGAPGAAERMAHHILTLYGGAG